MRICVVAVLLIAATARADPDPDNDKPLANPPTLGLGASFQRGHGWSFDSRLDYDLVTRGADRMWAGGFAELHATGFSSIDGAVGGEIQYRVLDGGGILRPRFGVGVRADGPFTFAALAFGTFASDLDVTVRRPVEGGPMMVAIGVELTARDLLP